MADTDYRLHRKVDEVGGLVAQLGQHLDVVAAQVAGVSAAQQDTHNELAQLRYEFFQFARRAELAANRQVAETKKGALHDQLEHQFGHHKVVRRTATGLLQSFDVGLVSDDTVRTVSEQLMIQTPRYWLAPALIGLAAWSADDQSLCSRGVEEAFRRSPSRTSLFFSLILRRQDRLRSANHWLCHYLDAANPMALGRDFAVILEAVAQGAFGPAGRDLVQAKLGAWTELLHADQATVGAQVARWTEEVKAHIGASAAAEFPMLAAVSPQWPLLDEALRAAGAHQALVAKYQAMLAEEITPSPSIEDAVDDILDRLVSEYDDEELPLRRELDLQDAIIDCNGDLDLATEKARAESAAREETLDYLTIQSTSALTPERIGVSAATQRVAVAACEPWFNEAHAQFSREYRVRLPTDVQASFAANHNFGAAVFNLPPWSGSFTTPMPDLERDLAGHWDRHVRPFIEAMRYDWRMPAILASVAVALVSLPLAVASLALAFVVALIGGGATALVIWQRFEAAERVRRQAEDTLGSAKDDSLAQLRQAGADLTDWTTRYTAADGREVEVRTMFAALKQAGHTATPFEQRAVTPMAAASDRTTP
jgi:hypothetical protein